MSKRRVVWSPQPKQRVFMGRGEYEGLYGGAAGGGKSEALVLEALRQVQIPHYKGLILRKTYPELGELIDKSLGYYPRAFPGAKYNTSAHTWTFPSGARVIFGSMQHTKDRTKYQGRAFDFIGFDELTHFTWDEYSYLFSRNRPNGPGTRVPEKTEGSAAVVLSTESAQLVAKTQISLANNFIKLSCPNRSGDMVLRSGAPVQILAFPAAFGDATAADVAAGKTFTSSAGLNVSGTGRMAEITTATEVMSITVDEAIQGYADRTGTYTCPAGYMPFNLSTNCTTATLSMTDYSYRTRKLTYNMVWYGSGTEDVAIVISLIKV